MAFSSHTFELSPPAATLGFVFEQDLGEGQRLTFTAQMPDGTVGAGRIADEAFGAIVESFSASRSADPYVRFEDALKAANLIAKKYASQMPELPNISVGFFDFLDLYIAQSGNAESYLLRGAQLSPIRDQSEEVPTEMFQNILSGQVNLNDAMIFSTQGLMGTVTPDEIIDLFIPADFIGDAHAFEDLLRTKGLSHTVVLVVGIGKASAPRQASGLRGLIEKGKSAVSGLMPERLPAAESEMMVDTAHATSASEGPMTEYDEEANNMPETEDGADLAAEPMSALPPRIEHVTTRELPPAQDQVHHARPSRMTAWTDKLPALKRMPKLPLMLGTGVLGLLVVILGVRSIANYKSTETLELEQQITIARQALNEAETFLLQGERTEAKVQLDTAQSAAQQVFNSGEEEFRMTAQSILSEIDTKRLATENAVVVEAAATADLGLSIDGVNAQGAELLRSSLYIYEDTKVHKTVNEKVDPGPTLTDKSGEKIIASATLPDQNTALFLTDTPRIIEYQDGAITPMNTEDSAWRRGVDLDTFGRYAYILDPTENQIWKYERRRTQYSTPSAYNLESNADLGSAVSMSIDGSIFVIGSDGVVQRLLRGQKVDYTLDNMPSEPLNGSGLRIVARIDLDFLYILDPELGRIVVLEKGENSAKYIKQIVYGVDEVRDMVINDNGTKAFLITPDRVHSVEL